MWFLDYNQIFYLLLSVLTGLLATYSVRAFAHKIGFVAKPKADRWHQKPTAMLGGVAIFLTTVISYLLFVPKTTQSIVIVCVSSLMFLLGLVDDWLNIKPYQKLFGQIIGAAIIISFGLTLNWTPFQAVNYLITGFWIIGITNAINLLDNMDGLAAGISTIAATGIAINFGINGQITEMMLVGIFIAALLGFLVFNFNPASIFMGDCGSLFVGSFLASTVLLTGTGGQSRSLFSILAVPVLILLIPIFDTTLVTIWRKMAGRPASLGGRDHTSHRLVALGLSERSAVLMLYGLAVLAGFIAILVRRLSTDKSIAIIAVFTLMLAFLGIYLGKVKVYEESDEETAVNNKALYGFLFDFSYKRRIFEVVLDVILIALAHYAAYIVLYGFLGTTNGFLYLQSLPVIVVCTLFAMFLSGVYRGIWRYTSVRDLWIISKGVALGTSLSMLMILLIFRFNNYPRTVFVVAGLLLFGAVSASRLAFRMLRVILSKQTTTDGIRVLIYGAGDGGELILREINNNPELNYQPIGFADDDPRKKGKVIHGLHVLGGNGDLSKICQQNDVQEILLSSNKLSGEKLENIRRQCRGLSLEIKRATVKIESIENF